MYVRWCWSMRGRVTATKYYFKGETSSVSDWKWNTFCSNWNTGEQRHRIINDLNNYIVYGIKPRSNITHQDYSLEVVRVRFL